MSSELSHPCFESRQGDADFVAQHSPGRFLRADSTGRWITLNDRRGFLHRTLDGQVVRRGKRGATTLDSAAATRAHETAITLACELAEVVDRLPDAELHLGGGDRASLKERLARVQAWPAARHEREAARYLRAYPEPVTILPPDRYRDVVVLPAVGCANRGCTFCTLHSDRPYRALTDAEFDDHLEQVARLFGPLLGQRDGVFLGSASALTLSCRRLLPRLERIHQVFGPRRRGVASFFDPDLSPARGVDQWRQLADAGLVLAVLGLETGDPELRAQLGKRGSLARLAAATTALGEGGIRRGLTVLVGAGGLEACDRHARCTVAAAEALELSKGDIVYLSPLTGSLPPDRLEHETDRLRQLLKQATPARVVPYRFELFRYYA